MSSDSRNNKLVSMHSEKAK